MKKIVIALFILALSVSLVADNAVQILRPQPRVISSNPARSDVVVYLQDFESGWDGWYSHDGTQPSAWWHLSDFMTPSGTGLSWWMGDTEVMGYIDGIYVVLDTDEILVPTNGELTFDMNLWCEELGTYQQYDGWDGANIRVSTDGGDTWEVIEGFPAYNSTSMYSFGQQHGEGPGVPGWGGSTVSTSGTDLIEGANESGWIQAHFDLSAYAGQHVRVRFAFASDPAYSTPDNPDMYGFLVDNIMLGDFVNTGTEDGMTPGSMVPVAGDLWHLGEPGDAPSPTHAAVCQNDEGTYNPGMMNYLYSPFIDLPEGADVITADFMIKGYFDDLDEFPNVDYFGWEISPNGSTWYAMSNPYGDPDGMNYVYSDAPDFWASMIESYSLDGTITEYAGQSVQFRIYFRSDDDEPIGEGIMIDDFVVRATVYQGPPPENLEADINFATNEVTLTWDAPDVPGEGWYHYDNGEFHTSIGTDGPAEFSVAARWTPDVLVSSQVTAFRFVPAVQTATYTIKIWQGANAANEIYSELVVNPEINVYNEIELASSVVIDPSQELWVGYAIDTPEGFPAGADAGPADAGFGDMIHFGGAWGSLFNQYGLNNNWNIQAYLAGRNGESIILDQNTTSRAITAYNVYRSTVSGSDYTLIDTVDPDMLYYVDHNAIEDHTNFYVVTALHDGEESAYSNQASVFVPPMDLVELYYDDGTAESTYNVGLAKTMLVKFTPGYMAEPLQIKFLKVYVETVNTGQVVVSLYNDSGANGMPGQNALFNMTYPSSNLVEGWNFIPISEQYEHLAQFTEGAFYLGIMEMAGSSNYGFDEDTHGRTYHNISGQWEQETGGNVMIRAIVQNAIVSNYEELVPAHMISLSNYPNPFNPNTNIQFSIPTEEQATIKIYNMKGQLVNTLFDGMAKAGTNVIEWNGTDSNNRAVSSGLYFYRLDTDSKSVTNKMMLLK